MWELFEYVTICSILAACSSVVGIAATALLMLLALAIWAKAGRVAMGLLMGILLAANVEPSPTAAWSPYAQPLLTSPLAMAIALWYGYRRRWKRRRLASQL
jgi:hypothetical protein